MQAHKHIESESSDAFLISKLKQIESIHNSLDNT